MQGEFRDGAFYYPLRVFYEDTDAAGIVYYANYLKFAERARTEALRAAGIHQSELLSTQGTGFVVAHCDIHYRQPAALDDLLSVETRLSHLKKVRLQMHQTIRRDSIDLVHLIVDIAMVDRDRKPARIPDEIIHALKTHMPTTS